jgi:hypothetical protein
MALVWPQRQKKRNDRCDDEDNNVRIIQSGRGDPLEKM